MRRVTLILGLLSVGLSLAVLPAAQLRAQVNTYAWSNVGEGVVSDGTFDFNATYPLPLDRLFVRVSTNTCDVFYEDTFDWSGTLHPIDQMGLVGVSRYIATLEPISRPAIADGGSGYVHLSRPVTLNPSSQITLSLDNLGLGNGTPMYVCFRVP